MSTRLRRSRRAGRRIAAAALAVALAALLLAAPALCRDHAATASASEVTLTATAPPSTSEVAEDIPAEQVDADSVVAQVDGAAAAAGGSVAVVVLDPDDDVLLASGGTAPTYTASLVKVLVVAELLARDESGDLTLSGDDLALMEAAVTASDDDAMSALWVDHDGDALVTDIAHRLGLTATAGPAEAGQWGQATTSASDYATFLAALPDLLDEEDAVALAGWMTATTATAADGFDQTFGLLSDAVAEDVAAKQGWMCCVGNARTLHSAGVLPDGRVVVLLGDFPESASWTAAQAALDGAAGAVVAGTPVATD